MYQNTFMKIKIENKFLEIEIQESLKIKNKLLFDISLNQAFYESINIVVSALRKKNKIMLVGNGGSAADAQHFASEICSKFEKKRKHLPAIALTTDTSVITSLGNDFGFNYIFSKQIEALADKGDILIAFTTSCKSKNIINALKLAKSKKLKVILFCGKYIPNNILKYVDSILSIKSLSVPRIQENHIFLYHSMCKIIDKNF
ncbi:SIS domain-containing phosphosugar binding protein [alpha proteobacterium HIMB59]|nr:SIS domain-containing phosphosugar binding protein [alpha proteobacterium HIMB59]